MTDIVYEKINEYSSVKISLASSEDLRSWSYGEVKSRRRLIIVHIEQRKTACFVSAFLVPNETGSAFVESIKE